MNRAKSAGAMMAATAVWLVQAIVGLVLLYIGSVIFYAAGLWPIGALLSIVMLIEVIGFGLLISYGVLRSVWLCLREPTPRHSSFAP